MKATKDNFWDWVDSLPDSEFLEMIPHSKSYILRHILTESHIEAQYQSYLERECYQCDWLHGCGEYFTEFNNLNEADLCSECAYQETTREKVRTEIQEKK